MTFELNWAVFFVALVTFIFGFIFKPLALVVREKAVWWWINRYLINKDFWYEVDEYVLKHCLFRHHHGYNANYSWTKGKGTSYSLVKKIKDGEARPQHEERIEITEKQYAYYTMEENKSIKELNELELSINKKHSTFKQLLTHFGHGDIDSVTKEINRLINNQEAKLAGQRTLVENFTEDSTLYSDEHIDKLWEMDKKDDEIENAVSAAV